MEVVKERTKMVASQGKEVEGETSSVCLLFKHPALAGRRQSEKKMNARPTILSHPSLVMEYSFFAEYIRIGAHLRNA